jgi:hypothetical protein
MSTDDLIDLVSPRSWLAAYADWLANVLHNERIRDRFAHVLFAEASVFRKPARCTPDQLRDEIVQYTCGTAPRPPELGPARTHSPGAPLRPPDDIPLAAKYLFVAAVYWVVYEKPPIIPWWQDDPQLVKEWKHFVREYDRATDKGAVFAQSSAAIKRIVAELDVLHLLGDPARVVMSLTEENFDRVHAAFADVARDLGVKPPRVPRPGRGPASPERAVTIDPATHALAILFQEPDITPTELADRVGVQRSTLYSKGKKWQAVRQTLTARDSGQAPKGTKSDEGDIEAESDHSHLNVRPKANEPDDE